MKILITDDSSFMRNMIKSTIQKKFKDCTFVEACNGEEAVDVYKKELPNLTLMDMTMPIMDGVEAIKHIKAFDNNCKVIMVSAMGQKVMIMESIKAGASDFIVKPVEENRLMEAISKII